MNQSQKTYGKKKPEAFVERVRGLDSEYLCPQHGRIFRGENVKRFLDWLEQLPVGITQD